MINEEKYVEFLEMIVACVSHGDYDAVKELSNLELEKYKTKNIKNKEEAI